MAIEPNGTRAPSSLGPTGFLSIDVNGNNVTMLVGGVVFLFETDAEKLVLSHHYRGKRVQEKYDRLYGVSCRVERKSVGGA